MEIGMDCDYVIDARGSNYTFNSKDIMKLCKQLGIARKVRVLAPQSKYFDQNLSVISDDYFGGWYQVKLCDLSLGQIRKYTFPNSKITISDSTLEGFRLMCQTREIPKDYIGRDFSNEDIIFLREFYRVKKVFGGFMLITAISGGNNIYRKVTHNEAKSYLIIDDPIVHLHI